MVMPIRWAVAGCRASNLARLRRARAGEQFGYADGCRPIIAHFLIFAASRCSRTSGLARISDFLRRTDFFGKDGDSVCPANRPACQNRQNSALRNGFGSSGIDLERYCKALGRSLDRPHLSHSGIGKSEEQSSGEQSSSSDVWLWCCGVPDESLMRLHLTYYWSRTAIPWRDLGKIKNKFSFGDFVSGSFQNMGIKYYVP